MTVAYGMPRAPRSSSLADVLDIILDKGLVIDLYVRVSLVGIELLTVDARIVVASVDTYLRFAQAVNRLELGGGESTQQRGLPEAMGRMQEGGAEKKTQGALSGAGEALQKVLPGDRRRNEGEESDSGEGDRRERQPADRQREDEGDSGDESREEHGDDRAINDNRRAPDERAPAGRR